jgi:undecaprenyl phosphate N,N'-diacetylbacillosamine 1-phosphate transferase
MFYPAFIKPFLDRIISVIVLIILCPVLVVIAVINYMIYKKVFFIQDRSGKDMKTFTFIKFKSMGDQKDLLGELLPDKDRLTAFGRFLRASSLDELPQLLLVLKGDMSLIGPRPLLVEYNSYYTEEQKRRFCVKPGISGWAQVNGRNKQTWQERFVLDLHYISHISFCLDIKIGILTVVQLIKFGEVNSSVDQTMPPFKV